MCFVSRPMKIITFLRKNGDIPNELLIFCWKETHSETKSWKSSKILTNTVTTTTVSLEIVEDFACESKFLHFSFFLHHFSSFFFFIFSSFPFFHFFIFLHFLSFSFIFIVFFFLFSFSFIFFHFLSFSLSYLGDDR